MDLQGLLVGGSDQQECPVEVSERASQGIGECPRAHALGEDSAAATPDGGKQVIQARTPKKGFPIVLYWRVFVHDGYGMCLRM